MVDRSFVNPLPKELRDLSPGLKILNLGCGSDEFGTCRMDFVETPTTTHVGDIQKKLPFNDGEFDLVYMSFVIEHLTDPGQVLREVHRIIKKDGRVVVLTDNAGFWGFHSGKYTKTLGKIHYGGYRAGNDMHMSLYTPEHLDNHLRLAGFTVKKIRYIKYSESRSRDWWKKIVVGMADGFLNLVGLPQVAGYSIYAEGTK